MMIAKRRMMLANIRESKLGKMEKKTTQTFHKLWGHYLFSKTNKQISASDISGNPHLSLCLEMRKT